jgi:hypothetical protein
MSSRSRPSAPPKPDPCPGPAPAAAAAEALLRALPRLCAPLGLISLLPVERQMLGGYLFGRAPAFVRAVVRALRHKPGLCGGERPGDPRVDPQRLAERQDRADALLLLRTQLELLLQLVTDTHLREQAGAVLDATTVLRLHAEPRRDLSPVERGERDALLSRALSLLPWTRGPRPQRPRRRPPAQQALCARDRLWLVRQIIAAFGREPQK